jgi:predicted nucleotidyltransferase
MNALIEGKRSEIERLCERLGVQRLGVFGSALRDDFDPARSDADFLVELGPLAPASYARAYFELKDSLEALLGRPVDLLTDKSLHNPHRRSRIEREQQQLYAR